MRWGLIGASRIAKRICSALGNIGDQQLVGVCSRSEERGRAFAAEQGVAKSYTDVAEMLADCRPEAVYVSSTNDQHAAQTLAALGAGCHVLCEKPLAVRLEDAMAMVRKAAAKGRVLGTNHHLRGSLAHQRLRDLLAAGVVGRVHAVEVVHAVNLPTTPHGWRLNQPDAGGGVVLDIFTHDIDLLRYLLQVEPVAIQSEVQHNGLTQEGLEDSVMSLVTFADGTLAHLYESFVAPHAPTRLDVLGTRGMLSCVQSLTASGVPEITLHTEQGKQAIPVDRNDLHLASVQAFVAACAGHGTPLSTGEDGMRAVAAAQAALQAAHHGRRQAIAQPVC